MSWGPHITRHEKEVWAKQERVIKATSRWHLQGMTLLPKSPLDSSPLGRGTRKVIRSQSFSLKNRAERKKREREAEREREIERERESRMHLLMQKLQRTLRAEQYETLTKQRTTPE